MSDRAALPEADRNVGVVLTMGDRPGPLASACESLAADVSAEPVLVVWNGASPHTIEFVGDVAIEHVVLDGNVGIPDGRDRAVRETDGDLVFFLDDDAQIRSPGLGDRVRRRFDDDPDLAVVTFRLIDEFGDTARRHVPRVGRAGRDRGGQVATFLGGACAVRQSAYEAVGGYWPDLWYGHEELDLAWRLIDAGWSVEYDATATVFHPRTTIGRHADGWRLTGRNRVWIARRNLPWPLVAVHTLVWLAGGLVRAPSRQMRAAYLCGWLAGWRHPIERRVMRWRTVWRLTRLGRPPVI